MEFKRVGDAWLPKRPYHLRVMCTVVEPLYEMNSKKFLNIELHENTVRLIEKIHADSQKYIDKSDVMIHSLYHDNKLKVKIPWRYNRAMCKMKGVRGFYSLEKDERITATIEYCGVWASNDFCGTTWKMIEMESGI